MSARSLLQKIKDVFGLQSGSTESQDGGDVDVTIEREPESGGGAAPPESDGETAVESPADDSASEPTASDEPVEAIRGIGPTYSDRLAGAGIETVSQLAAADAKTVAEAAETGETKAQNWIDRARNRQS